MIRTFIALPLPDDIKHSMQDAIAYLQKRTDAKWIRPEGMHITLKFLGNIEERLVKPIADGLDEIFGRFPLLHFALDTLGAFPSQKKARVIWAGLSGDTDRLKEVALRVDRLCSRFGIPLETRPFSAHITLGRLKIPSVVELDMEMAKAGFAVTEGHFYRSELLREGARYTVLHVSRLGP